MEFLALSGTGSAPGDVTSELPSREEIEVGSSQSQSFHVQNTTTKKKGLKRRYEDCKVKRRDAKMKDMTDTMIKTIKEVKEADSSLLIELEEKRMKYEDQRLNEEREYEERRRMQEMEYEDRRRRKERAFQLHMMQLLMGAENRSQTPYFSFSRMLHADGFADQNQPN